tara:strand:+ start:385 stop:954 length:570 start_codon:yes stop_codon:yes gene_type:complete
MSNFTDFFPAAGGGGGAIPKYQEFTSSGTFTPTQALIDAGGRVSYFVVAGGQRGSSGVPYDGGAGGEVEYGYMTLTSTTGCTITIGSGGSGSNGAVGTSSSVAFSSAGGIDITANGGTGYGLGKNWGSTFWNQTPYGSNTAFCGVNNFGKGGGGIYSGGGVGTPSPNSGCGSKGNVNAASGFTRITWFE